jgi:hypothetical protein
LIKMGFVKTNHFGKDIYSLEVKWS